MVRGCSASLMSYLERVETMTRIEAYGWTYVEDTAPTMHPQVGHTLPYDQMLELWLRGDWADVVAMTGGGI